MNWTSSAEIDPDFGTRGNILSEKNNVHGILRVEDGESQRKSNQKSGMLAKGELTIVLREQRDKYVDINYGSLKNCAQNEFRHASTWSAWSNLTTRTIIVNVREQKCRCWLKTEKSQREKLLRSWKIWHSLAKRLNKLNDKIYVENAKICMMCLLRRITDMMLFQLSSRNLLELYLDNFTKPSTLPFPVTCSASNTTPLDLQFWLKMIDSFRALSVEVTGAIAITSLALNYRATLVWPPTKKAALDTVTSHRRDRHNYRLSIIESKEPKKSHKT